jgi:hypothetical protein
VKISGLWTCPDCLSLMPADQEDHHRREHARTHKDQLQLDERLTHRASQPATDEALEAQIDTTFTRMMRTDDAAEKSVYWEQMVRLIRGRSAEQIMKVERERRGGER